MSGFPLPSVSPPTLADYQFSYNGYVIGADSPVAFVSAEGLDLPVIRTGDVARPRDTGEFIGLDLMSGRDIILTLDAMSDGTSLQDTLAKLSAAFIPPSNGQSETPFWFQLPNTPLLCCSARVRKRSLPIDLPWTTGSFAQKIVIALHATDPRIYAPTVADVVDLPAPTGLLTFPVTFPLTFGSSTGGTVTCDNTGNVEMRPLIVITGPVTNPVIENQTLGEYLSFSNPNQVSYTLNDGDTLTIDTDFHTVIYTPNGSTVGTDVRNWLQSGSTWWNLPPGNSTINFSSGDSSLPSPVPTATIEYAAAYISAT